MQGRAAIACGRCNFTTFSSRFLSAGCVQVFCASETHCCLLPAPSIWNRTKPVSNSRSAFDLQQHRSRLPDASRTEHRSTDLFCTQGRPKIPDL